MSLEVSRRERRLIRVKMYELLTWLSSTVNNPKVSDEAKESAKERLGQME